MAPDGTDWFLTAEQRGNPGTAIDAGRAPRAWTTGNDATVLVDGDEYLGCLRQALETARNGDRILLAGLEMDADLDLGDGLRLGGLLRALLVRAASRYAASSGDRTRTTPPGGISSSRAS